MLESLKRSKYIINANNSSYGNFTYNDEKYFFKKVKANSFVDEVNGYLNAQKLKVKRLVSVYLDNDDYYLIYEYEPSISRNKGLISDLFADIEYNNKSYDKHIFTNIIKGLQENYKDIKVLKKSRNDCFFEDRINPRLIKWYQNDKNFDKPIFINGIKSITTNGIIKETINYFNNLKNKVCIYSEGDPNTFNLAINQISFDLATCGYNNIYGEVSMMFMSYLLYDAYFAPKYNKNSYLEHDLIYKYIDRFNPSITYKNNKSIHINSNIVTSAIRKKYIKDYLKMIKEENIYLNKNLKYYFVMRILCVFNIENFTKEEYYYSLFLLHTIYNLINDDAINSLFNIIDIMEEI